ncbi:MAG: outer membrane lipoprotein carrier protein LolA [Bacteroides sp.]|nr:outer membrane lipoprotein carrier protein LolA [Bacteroides sp.]
MKKLFTLFMTFAFSCLHLFAQDAEIQKAAERYKNMNTLAATVVRTKHNDVLTQDIVSRGYFYYKKPDKMCMIFDDGKDMLLMVDNTFTMVADGKKSVAKGKGNNQFESLQAVFKNMTADEDSAVDLSDLADVEVAKQGNTCVLTVTPIISDAKARRKMMFTSFVLTVDLKRVELKSLRMNEKGNNYTRYDFSNYQFNAPVSDSVFNPSL